MTTAEILATVRAQRLAESVSNERLKLDEVLKKSEQRFSDSRVLSWRSIIPRKKSATPSSTHSASAGASSVAAAIVMGRCAAIVLTGRDAKSESSRLRRMSANMLDGSATRLKLAHTKTTDRLTQAIWEITDALEI